MLGRFALSFAFLTVAACSQPGNLDLLDLGVLPDIPSPPDLTGRPGDLGTANDLARSFSCRGEDAPGTTYQLVMNKLLLPGVSGSKTYVYDLDGDGRQENQLKNIISTVALAGLDIQTTIDDAVENGLIINLLSVTSAAVDTSACVGVSLNQGKQGSRPKFDGTDRFTPISATGSPLGAVLAATQLKSVDSRNLKPDTESQFELQISLGRSVLKLPLRGVHIEAGLQMAGPFWQLTSGALHGAVAKKDIDDKLVPAIADQLTQLIHNDPFSATSKTIIGLFESTTDPVSVTKCMTATRCCRTSPATCVILPEEVVNSPVGGVLAPDVEVLDGTGQWKPVAGGKKYNAMSVGIGFTAISASY